MSKYYTLKGRWFDPGDFNFRLPSFLSPAVDFHGLSLRFLSLLSNKEDLGNMRIVNCMFVPSAKIYVKKIMVTQSDDDHTPCIHVCPNACAADLHSS